MTIAKRLSAIALSTILGAGAAGAATFTGEFWDARGSLLSITQADAVIAGAGPTATFASTAIDYPNGTGGVADDNSTALSTFLGADAASLSGGGDSTLGVSVFRFTGFLDLLGGPQSFAVSSDDGFRLTIGGTQISAFEQRRKFGTTTVTADAGTGATAFELVYFENNGVTGVEFLIDGVLAQAADGPVDIAPVPLPAGLPLMGIVLGGLGLMARRRKG